MSRNDCAGSSESGNPFELHVTHTDTNTYTLVWHTLTPAHKVKAVTRKIDCDEDLERTNLRGKITTKTFISLNIEP